MQRALKALEKAFDIAYDDFLKGFDKVWCVKGLIATINILVVSRKMRPGYLLSHDAPWVPGWEFPHNALF